jgi:hypothetical protein
LLQSTGHKKYKLGLTTEPADLPLPHGEEVVAELLRMKIVVGAPDICKHVLQVTLRPHAVCALLDVLLASGHPAFGSRANRAQWRAKLHAAVAAKYPEPPEQASLPEAERNGFVPTAVLASIKVMAPSPAIPEDMDGTVSSAP